LLFTSAGNVTFGNAGTDQVTLSGTAGNGVTLQTTGTGTLTANAKVDGPIDLTLNTAGAASFKAAVGSATAIGDGTGASLIVSSAGTTTFESTLKTADGITQANAAGLVTFDKDVTIVAGTT